MAFVRVCSLDDPWEDDIAGHAVNGVPVLLACLKGGAVVAWQGICPHQRIPLHEGGAEGD